MVQQGRLKRLDVDSHVAPRMSPALNTDEGDAQVGALPATEVDHRFPNRHLKGRLYDARP